MARSPSRCRRLDTATQCRQVGERCVHGAREGASILPVGHDAEAELLDLGELPAEAFRPASYANKPDGFARFQEAVDRCQGMITVIPEYNGSFPGSLKYFIDLLRFPDSFKGLPCAFVGIAAGMWGGLRAVEQMQMVFQYRQARQFNKRVFIPHINAALGEDDRLTPELTERMQAMLDGFTQFVAQNPR